MGTVLHGTSKPSARNAATSTPWTAINLVDFFFVRRGVYVIKDIFNPQGGTYGRWGGRGLTAYVVMVPFFVTTPFEGPAAKALGDVDYSLFIGLPLAAIIYYVLSRGLDLGREVELAREEGILDLHGVRSELPTEVGRA